MMFLFVIPSVVLLPALLLLAWNSTSWDNGQERTIDFGQSDPFDTKAEMSGTGEAHIDGGEDGIMTLEGDAPRFRIMDNSFKNVEITVYAKRISEDKEISFQGFVIGARSKHYNDNMCGANTYYGRLTYDGRVSFQKELFHGTGDNALYPAEDHAKYLFPADEGVPEDQWIGIRFIVTDTDNGTAALLQLYADKEANGQWVKVLEFKDDGDWPVNANDGICNEYPHNKIILTPGFVFLRNDGLGEAEYRDMTIRELS